MATGIAGIIIAIYTYKVGACPAENSDFRIKCGTAVAGGDGHLASLTCGIAVPKAGGGIECFAATTRDILGSARSSSGQGLAAGDGGGCGTGGVGAAGALRYNFSNPVSIGVI